MDKKKRRRELQSFQQIGLADKYKNITFYVVLVQPEHSGNVGFIARVMENFNFKNLVLFNPIETVDNILSYETQGFAMHGKEILLNSEIIIIENQKYHLTKFKEYISKFDHVIATTAKGKRYTNIKRLAIFPEDLTIPVSAKPLNIAFVFGKESKGLTNDEISCTDVLLRIPTGLNYPTLNLSHACAIVLYEIFKKINNINIGRGQKPVLLADKEDRAFLYELIKSIINHLKIRTYKEENVFSAFKNIFERAIMSKKELNLITGLFSKVDTILQQLNLYK